MNCTAIIDTACVLWDVNDYEQNQLEYLDLKSKMVVLLDIFEREKPEILLRDEMIAGIMESFPWENAFHQHHDYNHRVTTFLTNIPPERRKTCQALDAGVTSTPTITKTHFSAGIVNEIAYLLHYLHSTDTPSNCYFAYPYLFDGQPPLTTSNQGVDRACQTIFFDDEVVLREYFNQFKKVFEHNPVHHPNVGRRSKKSSLRCYNGRDNILPQKYLDASLFANNRYYYYDSINRVYVVFHRHTRNKYHGHEQADLNEIPRIVREHFNI